MKDSRMSAAKQTVLLSIVAALFLLVANSAYWVHSNVFDKNRFAEITSEAVLSESSRRAIASGVTDRLFEGRPTAKTLVGEQTTNVVAGLLGTQQAEKVFEAGVERLHVAVTSQSQESLTIDLSGVKSTVQRLSAALSETGEPTRGERIPDELVIIDKQNIPDFYRYGVLFLWLGPAALIGATALLVYPFVKNRKDYSQILLIEGGIVALVGILALLIGPLFKPPLLANISAVNARVVASNIYDGFITTFNQQTYIIIGFGIVVLVAGVATNFIPKKR
jgi:hypothetical protein